MRAVAEQIRRFASADSNVLISGETGTGKNAVARELHTRGHRRRHPFVVIDCAALSPTLMDAELFGHERGAFTDAVAMRPGRFELAGQGTVYLDRVGELALEAQGKLLRIVEEKRVERLGGRATLPVNAHIVASSDARIENAVLKGEFRSDLFHRLRVLPIHLPALRERADDILPLARYFLARAALQARRKVPRLAAGAGAALRDYAWPGNVRELHHTVARALQDSEGDVIELGHLPPELLTVSVTSPDTSLARRPTLEEVERRYIASTLRHVGGHQTAAARLLGISRKALWEKRKRYGLD